MNKKTIQSVFLGMVLLLMYLPILLLAVYSFMDSAIIGRSGSFTVKNYVYLFPVSYTHLTLPTKLEV